MSKNNVGLHFLLFLLLSSGMAVSFAEIYQWKDERGNIHFGDEPPEDAQIKIMKPDTTPLGVQVAPPEKAEQWKQKIIEQSSELNPVFRNKAKKYSTRTSSDANEEDLCEGIIGECFTPEQERVCVLRYGVECKEMYYWKVCLHQQCEEQRLGDPCDSPYYLLDHRPPILTQQDIGKPFPLHEQVSSYDWQCLNEHGFFCDEVAFDKDCQDQYGVSCESLKTWRIAAQKQCKQQRGADCNNLFTLNAYRPASIAARKKTGIQLRQGGVSSEDLLLTALGIEKGDTNDHPQLQSVLESLPGLNIRSRRRRYDCQFD